MKEGFPELWHHGSWRSCRCTLSMLAFDWCNVVMVYMMSLQLWALYVCCGAEP